MGTMFEDEKETVAENPDYKPTAFVKSERELAIEKNVAAVKAEEPGSIKELLKAIEGDNYYAAQAEHNLKIVLFNGPPRSGKDTVAEFAMSHLGARGQKYRFAQPLKDGVHALFGFAGVPTEYFNKLKDEPLEVFKGVKANGEFIDTPRDAYIFMSEKVLKPTFGTDFFARVAVRNIKNMKKPVVVISDCGFDVEVQKLVEAFGPKNVALVHLYREGYAFKTDDVKDSRSYVTDVECEKFTIGNDGSVNDLYDEIGKILNEFAPE